MATTNINVSLLFGYYSHLSIKECIIVISLTSPADNIYNSYHLLIGGCNIIITLTSPAENVLLLSLSTPQQRMYYYYHSHLPNRECIIIITLTSPAENVLLLSLSPPQQRMYYCYHSHLPSRECIIVITPTFLSQNVIFFITAPYHQRVKIGFHVSPDQGEWMPLADVSTQYSLVQIYFLISQNKLTLCDQIIYISRKPTVLSWRSNTHITFSVRFWQIRYIGGYIIIILIRRLLSPPPPHQRV